jgi:FkbM family methyltransferase
VNSLEKKFESVEHEVVYELFQKTDEAEKMETDKKTKQGQSHQFATGIDAAKNLSVNTAERVIVDWKKSKILRNVTVFLKRSIRKCLRWYINPIIDRQNGFNAAVIQIITQIADANHAYAEKIDVLVEKQKSETVRQQEILEDYHARLELLERKLQGMASLAGGQLMGDFHAFQKMTYSQSGEDSITMYILSVLGETDFLNITYLDIGSNDPVKMNNTYFLYRHGARGVLVEANPEFIEKLHTVRPGDVIINKLVDTQDGKTRDFYILNGDGLSTPDFERAQECLKKNSSLRIIRTMPVETITIPAIIEKHLVGQAPTVMSLDIEGMELDILETIDFEKYRPLIFIIESIPYDTKLAVGQIDEEQDIFMKKQGYTKYAFTGINSIYIDDRSLH